MVFAFRKMSRMGNNIYSKKIACMPAFLLTLVTTPDSLLGKYQHWKFPHPCHTSFCPPITWSQTSSTPLSPYSHKGTLFSLADWSLHSEPYRCCQYKKVCLLDGPVSILSGTCSCLICNLQNIDLQKISLGWTTCLVAKSTYCFAKDPSLVPMSWASSHLYFQLQGIGCPLLDSQAHTPPNTYTCIEHKICKLKKLAHASVHILIQAHRR